jgi:hypothetical protein
MTGFATTADAVNRNGVVAFGRKALIEGDIFNVRSLWCCCRSFWWFQRTANVGALPAKGRSLPIPSS